MSTLVIADHLEGAIRDVGFELITAARALEAPVTVAVISAEPEPLAEQLRVNGVDEVLAVAAGGGEFDADTHTRAVGALIRDRHPSVVLTSFGPTGMSYAPGVAARHGLGFASDVFSIERGSDGLLVRRAFYAGKVHAEIGFRDRGEVLLMLRAGVWEPVREPAPVPVSRVEPMLDPPRTEHLRLETPVAGDVDITTADVLLAVGRGIGEQDELPRLGELAERLGATLAVSRPLVDAGWVPAERQVGQSGRTVAPKVYLALGISGAVQHLAGMKGSGTIIAVNTDPDAAIFGVAHYGAVCDLHEVIEELERLV
jgi:electron transfer flavoprotein alpha subunit